MTCIKPETKPGASAANKTVAVCPPTDAVTGWVVGTGRSSTHETLTVTPASADDAHRPLAQQHDLAAILSHVENRRVHNDYTIHFASKVYQIDRKEICAGLRGAQVRVEQRRDGSLALRFRERYLAVSLCEPRPKVAQPKPRKERLVARPRKASNWNKNFDLKNAPKVWQAAQGSGAKPQESW